MPPADMIAPVAVATAVAPILLAVARVTVATAAKHHDGNERV